ncbi:sorbosone dehydrogenase family protein [Methylicorpusculum oleiharenae]|uniref:PQQ-dependent sugar dehydrogenase n=1 Tax=Methylicorpusculum oleiharenae TaxID=1338687 RepID=UPI001E379091|nr:sorbosone dehydrogenase family protein [Methylicorpusculum oleiharenae]MCD2453145.1 sorbosone dehydrogenase family protein [Methylicorpusculum oleiharenae]
MTLMNSRRYLTFSALAFILTACGEVAQLPFAAGVGAKPQLPAPNPTLIPTINIAAPVGWPENATPTAAPGMAVNAFATGLDHPRWLYVLPNGDILVAETNAPPKPEDGIGIKGWVMKWVLDKVGAGGPSANRITLLRDTNGDGVAETRTAFIEGLNSPFGMALVGNDFYVANSDALVRFTYRQGQTRITQPGTKVLDLPGGPINHHWTKNILASADGKRLYVTVGSNSNVAENGMDEEIGRAAIWEVDPQRGSYRIFASGLRNPNGLTWEPESGTLWTVVNERDEIGSDLVPDYLTSVPDNSFYGWPYSYYGQHLDERVQPQRPDLIAKARVPDYALGTHTASLGLVFSNSSKWPAPFSNGVFIGQHGSWNREPRSGYKVIFLAFKDGKPVGDPIDVLTGFVSNNDEAFGRPVGVVLDKNAALLVADDVGNVIWRVTRAITNSIEPNQTK